MPFLPIILPRSPESRQHFQGPDCAQPEVGPVVLMTGPPHEGIAGGGVRLYWTCDGRSVTLQGVLVARYATRQGRLGQLSHRRAGSGGLFYSLWWTDRRGPRIKLDWTTRDALSRPHRWDAETDAGTWPGRNWVDSYPWVRTGGTDRSMRGDVRSRQSRTRVQ